MEAVGSTAATTETASLQDGWIPLPQEFGTESQPYSTDLRVESALCTLPQTDQIELPLTLDPDTIELGTSFGDWDAFILQEPTREELSDWQRGNPDWL
jgi:hypothetical protein|eukprot:SAG25_NODE_2896_length_1329_cov_1.094309_1_plen_98_part_00